MSAHKNPSWWEPLIDVGWEYGEKHFQRDWFHKQQNHELPIQSAQLHSDYLDTSLKYEEVQPAYRFGYGARLCLSDEYPQWNEALEDRLKQDWNNLYPGRAAKWEAQDRAAIRKGWDYDVEELPESEEVESKMNGVLS